MFLSTRTSVSGFEADDRPDCPKCGYEMYVSRRTLHPRLGHQFELQTFSCKACEYEEERIANQDLLFRC
jgi:C4-type Zn-finger protein